MRVAIVGKGGVGKTTIAGTLARVLGRRGRSVLAVDFDTNPGLALTLGVPVVDAGLPDEALQADDPHRFAYGWRLNEGVTPAEAVERFTQRAPDGVRLLSAGKIDKDKETVKRSIFAVQMIARGFEDPSWDVIGDIEAGPTTPYEGYAKFAELVLVVETPGWTAALAARRIRAVVEPMPTLLVGSRFDGATGLIGMDPDVRIPTDPCCAEADRLGVAPIDHCPDGPVVRAVEELADRLSASAIHGPG